MEIFWNIFIWFWFLYLWNMPWCFIFVAFDVSFILSNPNLVECLCITLIKQLTVFNSFYLGFFMSVLHAFYRHLNVILINFYLLLLL